MDFNKIQKNNNKNQEFVKNIKQSNLKGREEAKMRATMRTTMRSSKYPQNVRKTMGGGNLRETTRRGFKDKDDMMENDNADEDDFGGKTVKKKLRIRLTDEEYRLLQKLKAKKKNAQQ